MTPDRHMIEGDKLTSHALLIAAERFRDWTRTEGGAFTCQGVAEGSLTAENALLAAFVNCVQGREAA